MYPTLQFGWNSYDTGLFLIVMAGYRVIVQSIGALFADKEGRHAIWVVRGGLFLYVWAMISFPMVKVGSMFFVGKCGFYFYLFYFFISFFLITQKNKKYTFSFIRCSHNFTIII